MKPQRHTYRSFATRRRARSFLKCYLQPSQFLGRRGIQQRLAWWRSVKTYRSWHIFALKTNNKFNAWPFSGSFGNLGRAIDLLIFCMFCFPYVGIWWSQGNSLFVFLIVIRTYAPEYNEIWKRQFALDPVQTYPDPQLFLSGFKNVHVHTYPYLNRPSTRIRIHSNTHSSGSIGNRACVVRAKFVSCSAFPWARFCYVTGWKNIRI